MVYHTLVAPVGEDIETMFPIIRTFPTDNIVLITDKEDLKHASDFQKNLEKFKIPVRIAEVKNYSIDEIFKTIKLIADSSKNEIIINVASGNKVTSCLTLCAAYVHGIKAVGMINDSVVLLPIMRFSYYKILSEQKLRILKLLRKKKDCCASLEELSREMKMSLPLVSYHINGSHKVDGLKQMGLIETIDMRKKVEIKLSTLGKMLMAGYL
jgi:DNA-binding transcriptional ArsR family regulator